jgi:hypothetical protein
MKEWKTSFWRWCANRLPKEIVSFAFIRVIAFASSGEWSGEIVPDIAGMTALDRWDKYYKGG